MGSMARSVRGLRWGLVLSAGTVVGALGIALPYQSVGAYSLLLRVARGRKATPEHLEFAAYLLLVWATPVFFLIGAAFAASWVARRVGEEPMAHAVTTGLAASVVLQVLVWFAFPPLNPAELGQYLIIGVVGGYLGGLEARFSLETQEALYSASVGIGEAREAQDVVRALGVLAERAGADWVTVWRVGGYGEDPDAPLDLWASWIRGALVAPGTPGDAARGFPPASAVGAALARLPRRRDPGAAPAAGELGDLGNLGGAERAAWEERGICSALLLPLHAPSGERVGLLVAASCERRGFGKGAARAWRTAAAQAALALENLRLVEEAKRAGEERGVLLERQRLAREIHDALAQSFASISFGLSAARALRPANDPAEALGESSRSRHLEQAEVTAREGLAEARRLVWALRPESLERSSLSEALARLAEDWSEQTRVDAGAATDGEPRALLPEAEVALLRSAQEALSNVKKHASAARVMVTLTYLDDVVVLDVRDDGAGFDPAGRATKEEASAPLDPRDGGGFGFVSMRERAEGLGGSLRVESSPGEGTVLTVELPVALRGVPEIQLPLADRASPRESSWGGAGS